MRKFLVLLCFICPALLLLAGCKDANTLVDQNTEVPNLNWTYLNKYKFSFKIDDDKAAYNLYMNLRVTGDYKYSNLFVLIYQNADGKKPHVTRYEVKLANHDGQWLGKGSGNLYSYQVLYRGNYKFPAKGTYRIDIEQNMRDNPLRQVSDAGLRVEKAE